MSAVLAFQQFRQNQISLYGLPIHRHALHPMLNANRLFYFNAQLAPTVVAGYTEAFPIR